jgi:hypothetical protein
MFIQLAASIILRRFLDRNPVFSSRRKQAYISINRLFPEIIWCQPSPDSARDFWGNFRLWRRNYNINIARRMDLIRIM